jgi:transcriptional regulator with XRE-family HTH domain/KaiC/GvpD/RAD55 family RecA-like ATPase
MHNSGLVSTGVEWLDQLIGFLHIGENVVWEVEAGAPIELFMRAFLANANDAAKMVYVSFNHSPVTMREKLGECFSQPGFILVDCFTDGKGQGDSVFSSFYKTKRKKELEHVIRVAQPAEVESFTTIINQIGITAGSGTKYIFDSLTGMQDLWNDPAAAYHFFTYACPRLYDLRTIAYWILEKDAHTLSFRANLKHVTQVAIDLSHSDSGHTLRLLKTGGRALSAEAEVPQRYHTDGESLRATADHKRELTRLGKLIRAARLNNNLSQTELGNLLGVTASTISQAENGIIALSLTNLLSLAQVLEINLATVFNQKVPPKDPISIIRERDRTRTQLTKGKRYPVVVENLQAEDADKELEAVLVTLPAGAVLSKPFSFRKGAEFGLLLAGKLEVEIAGQKRILSSGDSIYLNDDVPNSWASVGSEDAKLIWIVALK